MYKADKKANRSAKLFLQQTSELHQPRLMNHTHAPKTLQNLKAIDFLCFLYWLEYKNVWARKEIKLDYIEKIQLEFQANYWSFFSWHSSRQSPTKSGLSIRSCILFSDLQVIPSEILIREARCVFRFGLGHSSWMICACSFSTIGTLARSCRIKLFFPFSFSEFSLDVV